MEQTSNSRGRDIQLKFTQDSQNPTHNHFDAIVLYAKSSLVCDQDQEDLGRHSPTTEQMTTSVWGNWLDRRFWHVQAVGFQYKDRDL